MPTRDHTFEQCKYELHGRVDRQQETLSNIKKEHKHLFPNAGIIDSNNKDYCYIRCLKRPKITSGPQLVKARQVVAQTIPSYDAEDEEDEDEETVLQPPHIALSSKQRVASDGTRPARKLCIQYAPSQTSSFRLQSSPPAPPASRRRLHTHTESSMSNLPSDGFNFDSETPQEQQIDLTVNKPSRIGPRSRSFFAIPDEYKELTSRAAKHVCFYTLFGNPMLNAEEIQQLLSVAWLKTQEETREKLKRIKTANTYLHSIHSRTRAHLVYECKHSIVELFALNHLPQHEIAEWVKYLLFQDRFIYREDGREAHQRHFCANEITEIIFRKYFSNMKMRGNSDDTFFDSINKVFICLVTSAMHHCLKAWTIGVYIEPPSTGNFRYDTTVTTYKWFIATWNAHPQKVRVLLLAAIKADIGARLAATQQNGSLESDQPLRISNTSVFEAELVQELAELAKSKHLSQQRIPDILQHKNNAVEDETTSVGKLKNVTMITRPTIKITLTDKWKNMIEVMSECDSVIDATPIQNAISDARTINKYFKDVSPQTKCVRRNVALALRPRRKGHPPKISLAFRA
ncbi:hypothetical protein BGX38DRAFT_1264868 [Terfezia claveryi]|nr:hypothetical protein BGX38DRAFT_1264868 [Terfezia claveryi]